MLRDILRVWGGMEVSPMTAYTEIFKLGQGYIQKAGELPGEYKSNPIGYYRNKGAATGHYRVFFEDTFEDTLRELQEADDLAIINGITYFGRKNIQQHASKMFAMIFDLDGVTDKTLNAFLSGAAAGAYPIPNFVALSGHGVHLYYAFQEPVSLYPYIKLQLKELKYALTDKMWNAYTSTEEKVQHQGINQGFRVLGGKTKTDAASDRVQVFRLNREFFTLDGLCEFVPAEHRVEQKQLWKEQKYTLAQAKRKFPEWYEKVVVNGDHSRSYWDLSEKVHGDNPHAIYDWWMEKIKAGASYHHRYFAIMCLAIYAIKCRKPYEELERDALELVPFLNAINPEEPFTEDDCKTALECYDLQYCTFPTKDIAKLSGIEIPPNKRNYQKQADHLEEARAIRDIRMRRRGVRWDENSGRPKGSGTAEGKVAAYRAEHPEASVTEVAKALGISRPTVYKWWDAAPKPEPATRKLYRYTPDGVEEISEADLQPVIFRGKLPAKFWEQCQKTKKK